MSSFSASAPPGERHISSSLLSHCRNLLTSFSVSALVLLVPGCLQEDPYPIVFVRWLNQSLPVECGAGLSALLRRNRIRQKWQSFCFLPLSILSLILGEARCQVMSEFMGGSMWWGTKASAKLHEWTWKQIPSSSPTFIWLPPCPIPPLILTPHWLPT